MWHVHTAVLSSSTKYGNILRTIFYNTEILLLYFFHHKYWGLHSIPNVSFPASAEPSAAAVQVLILSHLANLKLAQVLLCYTPDIQGEAKWLAVSHARIEMHPAAHNNPFNIGIAFATGFC